MQDNIRINAPIKPNETVTNPNRLRSPNDAPIINPTDSNRVNPKNSSESSQNEGLNLLLNHRSVYNRFIGQLAQTPGLSETLKKIMFDLFVQSEKGVKLSGKNPVLAELAEKLKMSPDQIVEALKYQNDNQTKYSGAMFDELRELFTQHKGEQQLELLLGRFLKSYNGFFSVSDTLKSIISNLKLISSNITKTYSQQLNSLIDKLITQHPASNLEANLEILKNEIIPFLSSYVATTNDFGPVRDTITLLINNIARFNTSSQEDVINKFVDLLDHCKFQFDLSDAKINLIKQEFAQMLTQPKIPQNEMVDTLFKLISQGSANEQSNSSRAVYRDVATSLLLDNSVFMPLTHLFLPINFQGTFVFSEVWIDKNATHTSKEDNRQKPATKLFVTFDIKGLGYFETTVLLSDKKADVSVSCPSTLSQSNQDIQNSITKIFTQNGFSINSMSTTKGQPPQKLQQVFQHMIERRRGVDVTV